MRVGILGGGQLGLMLAESLYKLDVAVAVLEPDGDSPAANRLAHVREASFRDAGAVARLFHDSDVVTFDSENIPLEAVAPFGEKLLPSLEVLRVCQDRQLEKAFLQRNGFPVVPWVAVSDASELGPAAARLGFPCIAKTTLGGYDGKGQTRLDGPGDVAVLSQQRGPWVLEARVTLRAELSVIVARDRRGKTVVFPPFENIHSNHVLAETRVPACLPQASLEEACRVATSIAAALDVVGLLTVEFFLAAGPQGASVLYVNELAPRTHNSGHVTRQACTLHQFDALARILADAPLGEPELLPGATWVMGNLLGDVWIEQARSGGPLDLSAWTAFPEVQDLYLYGKREARPQRKMGHFVVRDADPDRALTRARAFRHALCARPGVR